MKNMYNDICRKHRALPGSISIGAVILLVLSTIQLSSMVVLNGNTIPIANNVYAKYSNSLTQYQLNDCQIGMMGGSNCAINGLQNQADGIASTPVVSQGTSFWNSFNRNNINIDSTSGQQNSGDTTANGGNYAGGDSSGGGSQDNSGDTTANGGNFVGGDLNVGNTSPGPQELNTVSSDVPLEEQAQPQEIAENKGEQHNDGISSIESSQTVPFILPFP